MEKNQNILNAISTLREDRKNLERKRMSITERK